MKCPVCGADNKSTYKACYKCAHKLEDSGLKPKGDVNSLWYSQSERKGRQVHPPFWGDSEKQPPYEDKDDFIVLHDEASRDNAAQDLVDRGAPVPDNRTKLNRMAGRREVSVIIPSRPAPPAKAPRPRRVRIRWLRLALSTLVILAVFVGVGYGAFQLWQLLSGAVSNMTGSGKADANQEPLRERVMIKGDSWHVITFYGKDGEMVLVKDPKRSLPIQNGKAELLLSDQGYISDDLTEDKVTVSLEATIISPDKPERKITVEPYFIDVPLAPLKIVLPKEQSVSTNEDSMLVKIKVDPGSSRVLIGNQNVTDRVNADGYVSATVKIDASGINAIPISVETSKHRKNNYELQVGRPVMDVPIQLENPIPESTEGGTVKISGSTVAGAEITTDASLSGKVSANSNGIFSFTVKLKRWGWNSVSITAATQDGRTSTMIHRVNHVPVIGSYSMKAQVLDYSYLMTAADALVGRVYKIEGMVIKKIETDVSDYYLFNAGSESEPKQLIVEYTKEEGLKQDQRYVFFADVTGKFEGYPVLTLRFFGETPVSGTTSPGASATQGASASPASTAGG